jgi:UDP-3-O-[3-hydroxymyristoyl] glucosamine N-acyltransferase
VYICSDVLIGSFVKLNIVSKFFHDSCIGEHTKLAPGATVLGFCHVGNDCFLGSNCTIKNGLKIDKEITIGMGSVITKSLSNKINYVFIGNPAIPLIKEK